MNTVLGPNLWRLLPGFKAGVLSRCTVTIQRNMDYFPSSRLFRPTMERNVLKDQIPEVYWFMAYLLEALWSRLPIQKLLDLISKASITRSQNLDCKPLCISAVILQLLPLLSLINTWLDIAVSLSIYVG